MLNQHTEINNYNITLIHWKEAGEVAQLVEYLLYKNVDLSLEHQTYVKI